MEITLNPASASDPIDQTRPQDEPAPADDAFGMVLAMTLQSAVVVTPQLPATETIPEMTSPAIAVDANPDGAVLASAATAAPAPNPALTGLLPSGAQSAGTDTAPAELELNPAESPELINLEQ